MVSWKKSVGNDDALAIPKPYPGVGVLVAVDVVGVSGKAGEVVANTDL